jgi:hypothetical protein
VIAIAKGRYTPALRDDLITRLYHVAKKFDMPMSRMMNLIMQNALDELEKVDPDEWEIVIPIRTEEEDS